MNLNQFETKQQNDTLWSIRLTFCCYSVFRESNWQKLVKIFVPANQDDLNNITLTVNKEKEVLMLMMMVMMSDDSRVP